MKVVVDVPPDLKWRMVEAAQALGCTVNELWSEAARMVLVKMGMVEGNETED